MLDLHQQAPYFLCFGLSLIYLIALTLLVRRTVLSTYLGKTSLSFSLMDSDGVSRSLCILKQLVANQMLDNMYLLTHFESRIRSDVKSLLLTATVEKILTVSCLQGSYPMTLMSSIHIFKNEFSKSCQSPLPTHLLSLFDLLISLDISGYLWISLIYADSASW